MSPISKDMIEPFERFHEHQHKCSDLLHMSRDAIHFVQARPSLLELSRDELGDQADYELKRAEYNAKIAAVEVANDHPLLHAQATIAIWGSLETLVRDFLAFWIVDKPEAKALEQVKTLKIGFGEYEALPSEDRAAYLLERLEDRLGCRNYGGIERFEAVFRLFGLSSSLESQIVRDLLELSAVRNLLVHRRGIVDARFKTKCPWISNPVGSQFIVSHKDYHRYFDAVDLYVFEIIQRLLIYHGLPRTGHKPECRFYKPACDLGKSSDTVPG
jgi:hypothetical protein